MPPIPLIRSNTIAIILFCFALFTTAQMHAQCTAAGPNNPGAAKDSAYPGSNFAFNSPNNVLVSDGSYATAASIVSLVSGQTDYLKVSNFGFTIPTSATICGIQVDVEKSGANLLGLAYITDNDVQLVKNGTISGNNEADLSTHWNGTNTYYPYGSNSDLWGLSWTPTDINASTFGMVFSADIHGLLGVFPIVQIDNIRITVYYSVVLPIQLTKFDITGNKYSNAVLQWKTGEQTERAKYAVQRSSNGTAWETLANNVQSDVSDQSFTYTDIKPLPGESFYRLKMVSTAGVESYSEVKSFLSASDHLIKCYPNPTTSYIQIEGVIPGERVQLTDIYGQRIISVAVNSNPFKVDVSLLQPGAYFITVGNRVMKVRRN